ncbi:hypothetical protein CP533_0065 [Ophiocordyceps camponoti-saundersi (nom. inval.)]|nr:hypothetical protein CP533_0065 [Ophiocordyceps camponoti-saundersi (nom. inval.)]
MSSQHKSRPGYRVQAFDATTHSQLTPYLAAIHASCITHDRAMATFLPPLSHEKLLSWWKERIAEVSGGRRLIWMLVRESHGDQQPQPQQDKQDLVTVSGPDLIGVVMLALPFSETGALRATVEKLLVHRAFRRRGGARALMAALEEEAAKIGRSLLLLDTESGSAAETVYRELGYVELGRMPMYGISPSGDLRDGTFFYKHLAIINLLLRQNPVPLYRTTTSCPSSTGTLPPSASNPLLPIVTSPQQITDMPPRKRTRAPVAATPTPSRQEDAAANAAATADAAQASGAANPPTSKYNELWTDDQIASLFKGVIRWKPAGMHKHFRIIAISEHLRNHGFDPDVYPHTRIPHIWQKLRSYYNLDLIDERETFDDDESEERYIDFSLPHESFYLDSMLSRAKANPSEVTSSPPQLDLSPEPEPEPEPEQQPAKKRRRLAKVTAASNEDTEDATDAQSTPQPARTTRGSRGRTGPASRQAKDKTKSESESESDDSAESDSGDGPSSSSDGDGSDSDSGGQPQDSPHEVSTPTARAGRGGTRGRGRGRGRGRRAGGRR